MDIARLSQECREFCRVRLIESTAIDGHQVGRIEYTNIQGNLDPEWHIQCQCDLSDDRTIKDNAHQCAYKELFRTRAKAAAIKKYRKYWKRVGLEGAVLHIFRKVSQHHFLGQHYDGIIYVEEVAEILMMAELWPSLNLTIWQVLDSLFKQEKLDLNGAILTKYVRRFRFPREIQQLFRFLIEEPLGWPNGEAGDGFIYTLEQAINRHTPFKSGREAFWPHNFPNLDPDYLFNFGFTWMRTAIERAQTDDEAARSLFQISEGILDQLDIFKNQIKKLLESDRFKAISDARQKEINDAFLSFGDPAILDELFED